MTKEEIITRLRKIVDGIEVDTFTIDNINRLIKDIQTYE